MGSAAARRVEGATQAELPPLWYRMVTGRVLWWRMRRVGNRVRWLRRHQARRALRWIDRNPEIEQTLARDGVKGLVAGTRWTRRSWMTRRGRTYRPRIAISADIDTSGLPRQHPLVRCVELVREGGAEEARGEPGSGRLKLVPAGVSSITAVTDDHSTLLVGAVDGRIWNPRWYRRTPTSSPVDLGQLLASRREGQARRLIERAQRAAAVRCGDAPSRTSEETASGIAELAATGAPLTGHVGDEVAALLGTPLLDAIAEVDADALGDEILRERHSIRLRRLAHRDFSPRGTWRRIGAESGCGVSAVPRVSVLLPSNRSEDVIDAARQVAAQCDVHVQLLVGLHGSHMSNELDEQLAEVFPGDLVVRHLPDSMNLGQVLNALSAEADGELVSKWDDDDWYDRQHLGDLVAALEYSGSAMVAKAAEFVYLEALDLTIRRFSSGSERNSTTVAGGTLLLTRHDLEQVRWMEAPRRVDRLLIEALEDRGQHTYRTHGFGYVLRRRGGDLDGHTWQVGDSYFLRQSDDQRRGLDLQFAGFDPLER